MILTVHSRESCTWGTNKQRSFKIKYRNVARNGSTQQIISLCHSITVVFEKNIFAYVLCEMYHEFFIVIILPVIYETL